MIGAGSQCQRAHQFDVIGAEVAQHVAGQGEEHDDGQPPACRARVGAKPSVAGCEQP